MPACEQSSSCWGHGVDMVLELRQDVGFEQPRKKKTTLTYIPTYDSCAPFLCTLYRRFVLVR
jgi:hypothetical protein